MRCLTHITLVTVIQFIACYLAGWGNAETIFMLFFIVLWQGLFIWLFSQIRKKRNVSDEFKFSKGVWYITIPVSSLLSPLLSLMVFIIGTLYELRRVREGANKRGNSSRLTQSFHFFMFEPIFSPVNALNQPI